MFAYPGGINSGDPARPTYTWLANAYPYVAPYGTVRNPGEPDFEHGRYGFIHTPSVPRYDHNMANTTHPEGDILKVLVYFSFFNEITLDPGYYDCWATNSQHWIWCDHGMGGPCESYCATTGHLRIRFNDTYNLYKYDYGEWILTGSVINSTYGPETTFRHEWACNACNDPHFWP